MNWVKREKWLLCMGEMQGNRVTVKVEEIIHLDHIWMGLKYVHTEMAPWPCVFATDIRVAHSFSYNLAKLVEKIVVKVN